jgi:hypothetical protein
MRLCGHDRSVTRCLASMSLCSSSARFSRSVRMMPAASARAARLRKYWPAAALVAEGGCACMGSMAEGGRPA